MRGRGQGAGGGANSQGEKPRQVPECRPPHELDRVVIEVSAGQTRPSLPSQQLRHMSTPPARPVAPKTRTSTWGAPHPASQPRPPPRGARAHMVCSRGFPRKAFSGMALMLLLWKPLGDNTGVRGAPGCCPTARQEGWGQRDAAGDPGDSPPSSATLGKASQCAGGGGEGGEEQAQTSRRARGRVQRERGSRERRAPRGGGLGLRALNGGGRQAQGDARS